MIILPALLLLLLLPLTPHTMAVQEHIPELPQSRPGVWQEQTVSVASEQKFMHASMVKHRYFCTVCASVGFCFKANKSVITPWCRQMVNLSDIGVRCESLLMSARKSFNILSLHQISEDCIKSLT